MHSCFLRGSQKKKQRLFRYTTLIYRFYNQGLECLLRGTSCVFKSDGYSFVIKGFKGIRIANRPSSITQYFSHLISHFKRMSCSFYFLNPYFYCKEWDLIHCWPTSKHFIIVIPDDVGVDGSIILGWVSRRWDVGIWTGLGWPRIETGGGRLWLR